MCVPAAAGDSSHMPCFLIHHRHDSSECSVVFAAFKGLDTPLRHRRRSRPARSAATRSGGPWRRKARRRRWRCCRTTSPSGRTSRGSERSTSHEPFAPQAPHRGHRGRAPDHRAGAHPVRLAERPARAARTADRVAGPAPATATIEQRLAAQEGAFEVHRYADEASAREAIADREVYGAFVATSGGPKILSASAASPAVAQLLSHAAGKRQSRTWHPHRAEALWAHRSCRSSSPGS